MTESKEKLKSLLKEKNNKAALKLRIKKKTKIMASSPITSWQTEGENMEAVTGSKITVDATAAMKLEGNCFLAGKL